MSGRDLSDLGDVESWFPDMEEGDAAALRAVADLGGRTGARDFQVSCQSPDLPYAQRSWWAQASYAGARLIADGHVSVRAACDALARRMLDGGACQGCGKLTFVANEDGYRVGSPEDAARAQREGICRWSRDGGERWSRACGDVAPPGSSREKLAQAMRQVQVIPAEQIRAARAGRYDDYLSDYPMPQHLLLEELRPYGRDAEDLVRRVIAGEFDATAAESQAWAQSPEGQETLAAFGGKLPGAADMTGRRPVRNASRRGGRRGRRRGK